jgi:hypothetical protein
VKEPVRPVPAESVEVATPYTPFVPLETRRFEEASVVVVARPVYAMVVLAFPTREPSVPESAKGPEKVAVVVATFAKVLGPEKYARLPCTAAVEVERPPKERVGEVPPLEMIGKVPETEVTPLLIEEVATHTD